jgi:anti-sigma B factor antagonist
LSERNGWTVVHVAGDIDVYSAPTLRTRLNEVTEGGVDQLVVDLAEVGFVDSTGLGSLIGVFKSLRSHNGEMRLAAARPNVARVIEITGLDKVFPNHGSVAEATEEKAGA